MSRPLREWNWGWVKSWEMLLFVILLIVIFVNTRLSEFFFEPGNLANVFQLRIEMAIVAIIMTFLIINGEIDLSVASVMGLAASLFAYLFEYGWSTEAAILAALAAGLAIGFVNGFFVAVLGLPSLVVTLAGLIGFRGAARILLEDRSVGNYPSWFTDIGQQGFIGPFPITIFIFIIIFAIFAVVLHYTAFGRYVYIIGNNKEAAQYAGVKVRQVKMTLFLLSGLIAAFAGILYASRLGTVRANAAQGFELDIVAMVLLGGVSIFGGKGTLLGVGLSLLVVLNMRNGMSLDNISGNTQTSIIGVLLILSVLIPNWLQDARRWLSSRTGGSKKTRPPIEQEVQHST
ncbi:MAG: ABC transporter permease [Anaerolineales bacterium]